ncbi:hypothetical protein ALO43_200596 [Pseudomonas tremae]|uniref:LuxR family transcriptional regulator n=1 Tax=Pseudomonas tremae TaxID=200454 RepID=A0AA40P1J3_9PSED|nr:hypothetical protein ALO43_200596 [Pseudomonas tremae]
MVVYVQQEQPPDFTVIARLHHLLMQNTLLCIHLGFSFIVTHEVIHCGHQIVGELPVTQLGETQQVQACLCRLETAQVKYRVVVHQAGVVQQVLPGDFQAG